MHSTEVRVCHCAVKPWERKRARRNNEPVCEHGDSRLLAEQKRARRLALRQADRRAIREDA